MTTILQGLQDVVSSVIPGATTQQLERFFEEDLLHPIAAALREGRAGSGRTVVLLPGLLGSSLVRGPQVLWLAPADLDAVDELTFVAGADPAADRDAVAGAKVEPGEVLWEFYGLMQLYFQQARGFDVIPFPFDWRRSCDQLADDLFTKLPPAGRLSIVAHSQGCLVARRCVQLHRGLVDRIDHAVFLAPPFQGTYGPLTAVAGDDWLTNLYSTVSRTRAAHILAGCPGFFEMMPDPEIYPDVDAALRSTGWMATPPSSDVVKRALRFAHGFRKLDGAAQVDDDTLMRKASLVIGLGFPTPSGITVDADGKAVFGASTLGDDTVLAQSAWDDRATGKYRASSLHAFAAQDVDVIQCAAALVESDGRDAGDFLDPIKSLSAVEGSIAAGPPTPPSATKPSGFDERRAQGQLNNADLHFLFAGVAPS